MKNRFEKPIENNSASFSKEKKEEVAGKNTLDINKSFVEKAADVGWDMTDKEKERFTYFDGSEGTEKKEDKEKQQKENIVKGEKLEKEAEQGVNQETEPEFQENTKKEDENNQEDEQEIKGEPITETKEQNITEKKEALQKMPDFSSERAKGVFDKLSEKTKQFVVGVYENVKMNSVDVGRIMMDDILSRWHNIGVEFSSEEIKKERQNLKKLKEKSDAYDQELKSIEERYGKISGEVGGKALLERRSIDLDISLTERRIESEKRMLKNSKENKKKYDSKKQEIIESFSVRIAEQIKPYHERMEFLTGKKDVLDSEIVLFNQKKEDFEVKLDELEEEISSAQFDFSEEHIRNAVGGVIDNIRQEIKLAESSIKKRIEERAAVEKELLSKANKVRKWEQKQEELSKEFGFEVDSDNDIKNDSSNEGAETEQSEGLIEDSDNEWDKYFEGEKETMPAVVLVSEWNKYFASELFVEVDDIVGGKNKDGSNEMSLNDFEEKLKVFFEKLYRQGKMSSQTREISKKIKTLETYLKYK